MFNPIIKTVRAIRERGVGGLVKQLYMVGDIKFGVLKGTDAMGNKYYEDLDLPYGQHRWIEYKDCHNFDATMIQPDWHGWLHHMYDEVPGEAAAPDAKKTVIPTHSSPSPSLAGINSHVYESNIEHREMVNNTQLRQRGYKVGSLKTGPEDPDQYFMQKSHPLHKDAFSGQPGSRHEDLKNKTSSFYHSPGSPYMPARPGPESDTPEVRAYEKLRAEKEAL